MPNYALVNNVDHQDTRIITDRSAKYGDNVMFAMTFPTEFRSVQASYPILLHRDGSGEYYPIALFGFQKDENLFLSDSGWNTNYIPAMILKEPFLIGFQNTDGGVGADPTRVLSIDMDSPRVNTQEGEALFQPLGGWSDYLQNAATMLEFIYEGHTRNKEFAKALQELELIESVTFDIQLKNGERNQLLGFHVINEEKLQALSGNVLQGLAEEGFLLPIFMMLASTSNVQTLIDIKNRRLDD